jgi:sec-independent protein translocase protein TatA
MPEVKLGELSIWHWLIVLIVVMLLFGSGKVSTLMGDFAKGVKTFKKTMAEEDKPAPPATAIAREDKVETNVAAEKTPVHHEG